MRKTKNITLFEDGRELKFLIKQMSAMNLARWCAHLTFALSRGGLALPGGEDPAVAAQTLKAHGLGGLLRALGGLDVDEMQPLMDELLACCYHLSEPGSMTQLTPGIVDSIISELPTLMKLAAASLELNLDFIVPEGSITDRFANPSGFHQAPATTPNAS